MRKPFDFPITAIYWHEAYLIAPRPAKLAIWQILAFWWVHKSETLPDEQGLSQISGLRENEWKRYKSYIENAISKIFPVLQADYNKKKKIRKILKHNGHLGNIRKREKRKQMHTQAGNEKGFMDVASAAPSFAALKPNRPFNASKHDLASRSAIITKPLKKSTVTFTDQ